MRSTTAAASAASATTATAGAGAGVAADSGIKLPVLVAFMNDSSATGARMTTKAPLKILLLGNSDVGKTALITHIAGEPDRAISTIGVDFRICKIKLDESSDPVKFQIWDTAGQERFRTVTSSYLRGADCVLIMCKPGDDIESIKAWHEVCKAEFSKTYTVHYEGEELHLEPETPESLERAVAQRAMVSGTEGELGQALLAAVATHINNGTTATATAAASTTTTAAATAPTRTSMFSGFSLWGASGASASTTGSAATATTAITTAAAASHAPVSEIATVVPVAAATTAAAAATTPAAALVASIGSLFSSASSSRQPAVTTAAASATRSHDHRAVPTGGIGSLNG